MVELLPPEKSVYRAHGEGRTLRQVPFAGSVMLDSKKRNRLAGELQVVVQAVSIGAHFNVVSSMPLMPGQVKVRQPLQSADLGCSM